MGALEQIGEMKKQGLSENDIISKLQQQGISPKEINDALNQSQIKQAVGNPPQGNQEIGMETSVMDQSSHPIPQASQSQRNPPSQQQAPQENYNYQNEFPPQEEYYPQEGGQGGYGEYDEYGGGWNKHRYFNGNCRTSFYRKNKKNSEKS